MRATERPPARIWILWCHKCSAWLDEDATREGAYGLLQEHDECSSHAEHVEAIRYDPVKRQAAIPASKAGRNPVSA